MRQAGSLTYEPSPVFHGVELAGPGEGALAAYPWIAPAEENSSADVKCGMRGFEGF
jgi:hypothetical protein